MKRTPETFRLHLEKRVAACRTSYLVMSRTTLLGTDYKIVQHVCSSNWCEHCRRQNLRDLRQKLQLAMVKRRWRLVTLTFGRRNVTPEALLKSLAHTLACFMKRVRKRWPDIAYARTIEMHRDGYPHVHLVIDRYVPKGFIALAWKELGGGFIDIRDATHCKICGHTTPCQHHPTRQRYNYKDAAHYLTEEIEKAAQDPHKMGVAFWCAGLRSITVSRNLKLLKLASEWRFLTTARDLDDVAYLWSETDGLSETLAIAHRHVKWTKNAVYLGPSYNTEPPGKPQRSRPALQPARKERPC